MPMGRCARGALAPMAPWATASSARTRRRRAASRALTGGVVALNAGRGPSAAMTQGGVVLSVVPSRAGAGGRWAAECGRMREGGLELASSAAFALMSRGLTRGGDVVRVALGGDHTLTLMCTDAQGGRAGWEGELC